MWVVAEYQPTALFSLRPATATSSGGKSLIIPTAFAVKMALLDALIRTQGVEKGRALFPTLRDLRVAVLPPERVVVNSTFTKILRLKEIKSKASEKSARIADAQSAQQWPFQKTIAYREYVQLAGSLKLGFEGATLEQLGPVLVQINYLGKRGGFMQLQAPPVACEELPEGFIEITAGVDGSFPLGLLQIVDDCGPKLTFDQASVFSSKGISLGKDRILHHVVLPYRLVSSSRGYTLYERFDS